MPHKCYVPQGKFKQKFILAICYAISTKSGSEPGAGWAVVRAHLSLGANVRVITTPECAKEMRELEVSFSNNLQIISIEYGRIYAKLIQRMPLQVKYISWNFYVRSQAKKINFSQFDVIHHVTYAGDWNPTVIHLLPKKLNTLWGPIGGAQKIPRNFTKHFSFKARLSNSLHSKLGDFARFILSQRIKRTKTLILAANSATENRYRDITSVINSQNVSFPSVKSSQTWRKSLDADYFFGAGRLLYWKNWETPIRAMSYLKNEKLLIAGDGPHLRELTKLIAQLNLEERVFLLGRIDREEVLRLTISSKGVVFPSLRDSASWALGEALHLGAPVVAFDLPGNRSLSDRSNLDLVSISTNPEFNFATAMSNLGSQLKIESGSQCSCAILRKFENEVYPRIFGKS
jgi:glycosyltransferase involved in cell wall biosynthesis